MTLSRLMVLFALAGSAMGQPPLKFEVATIKPAAANAPFQTMPVISNDRLYFQGVTLRNLIYFAYASGLGTAFRVTGGPDWSTRNLYEVQGLAQGKRTNHEFRMMVRNLLEERFGLKFHQEAQPLDVYALVPLRSDGKLGPKIQQWDGTCQGGKPTEDDDPALPRCFAGFRPPGMLIEGSTMFSVAELLSLPQARNTLGRIVQDQTGLKGRYKLELEFQFGAPPDAGGPSLLTAVREQWGLKLEPAKGTLEVIVIDSAEPPTAN